VELDGGFSCLVHPHAWRAPGRYAGGGTANGNASPDLNACSNLDLACTADQHTAHPSAVCCVGEQRELTVAFISASGHVTPDGQRYTRLAAKTWR